MSALLPVLTLVVLGGLGVTALWRPALACAFLMLLVPLTTGLARGGVIPLLKPSEAMVAIVVAGAVVNRVVVGGGRQLTWLDLVVALFGAVSVGVPTLVLLANRAPADVDTWRTVLAPVQLLAVYALFSRVPFSASELRLVVLLSLLGGAVVAAVAVAELLDLGSVRDTVGTFYPSAPRPAWDTTYRPDSLAGHYSAVGGICLFCCILASAAAAARPRLLPWVPLSILMLANAIGIIASQTFAPFLLLPLAPLVLLVTTRRIPRETLATGLALAAGLVVLWPSVSKRVATQGLLSSGQLSLVMPETMQTRMHFWSEFIVPALQDHLWLGTGTVIPGTVPAPLTNFVDNEYLWQGFRAGAAGIASLVLMLLATAWLGWRMRNSPQPWHRVVGPAAALSSVAVLLVGLTAQYLTFGGLVQQFGMIAGLLSGAAAKPLLARRTELVVAPRQPSPWMRWRPRLRRPRFERRLLTSSAIVLGGFSLARLLGFLFSVATAHILAPSGFGALVYGIAVVNLASVLISAAPNGLGRFLARAAGHEPAQSRRLSNWVVLVVVLVVASAAISLPAAAAAGLSAGMLAAVALNLVGIAALETYREAQRGLDAYWELVAYYVLANGLQLAAVLALGAAGVHSAATYLAVYGLSGIAPLPLLQSVRPLRVKLRWSAVTGARVVDTLRFIWPVLLQSVFYAVWLGFDVIVVQHRMGPAAAGNYGAAKTLVNVLILPGAAVSMAAGPRAAQLVGAALRKHVLGALGLALASTLPLVAALALLAQPVCAMIFGARYPLAPQPIPLLALGMLCYALYSVLSSTWIGLGRPRIDAVGSGTAMVVTVALALTTVPSLGLMGAAGAFTAGSAARLAVMTAFTTWAVARRSFAAVEILVARGDGPPMTEGAAEPA